MILVTGGLGYIGSHTIVALAKWLAINQDKNDCNIAIADNLSNSQIEVLEHIRTLCQQYRVNIKFYQADVRDESVMDKIFCENYIDTIIHFAGLKAVGDSVGKPIEYYSHNINATLSLVKVMLKHNCRKIVFSSSATVYGESNPIPYTEDMPTSSLSPYGWTKVMQERILSDICTAEKDHGGFWAVMLRYFNPIGAHESGQLGDDPNGIPNNLMPYICRVASKNLPFLPVYGEDYPTPDGTCIRDYIHVCDLARGHVNAVEFINNTKPAATPINLGTGRGYSVKELIAGFERACGFEINKKIYPRRSGDISKMEAGVKLAKELLNWQTEFGIEKMCEDSWNYIKNK